MASRHSGPRQVTSETSDTTPDVVIGVTESGTIAVAGTNGCGLGSGNSINSGSNTVTLSTSGTKTYACTITFTDTAGNAGLMTIQLWPIKLWPIQLWPTQL